MNDWSEGDRVEGGDCAEDYDTGTVRSVRGSTVRVAWDSGVATFADAHLLRPEGERPYPRSSCGSCGGSMRCDDPGQRTPCCSRCGRAEGGV